MILYTTMSTAPTQNMRMAADGPAEPPAHGRQTTTGYQSQPSPTRLIGIGSRRTQARVDAPCIQIEMARSRSIHANIAVQKRLGRQGVFDIRPKVFSGLRDDCRVEALSAGRTAQCLDSGVGLFMP